MSAPAPASAPAMHPDGHGLRSYRRGCRCRACREAGNTYVADRRRAATARANAYRQATGRYLVLPDVNHGMNGYHLGCRCQVCRTALSAKNADDYARRQARRLAALKTGD